MGKQTAERQWTYFHYNLSLSDNSTSAQVDDVEVSLNLPPATGTSVSGKVYLPKSGSLGANPYDADGHLTKDGLWNYTWDGAGRLVAMEHRDTEITDPTERIRIEFRYDFAGRRIEKAVYPGASGGGYSSTADSITRFIYDGWLLMAELDGKNGNELIRSYSWSRDISGTRSGAAGMNVYGFVGNNPLMFVDPLGLEGGPQPWSDPVGVALEYYGTKIECHRNDVFSSTQDNWLDITRACPKTWHFQNSLPSHENVNNFSQKSQLIF